MLNPPAVIILVVNDIEELFNVAVTAPFTMLLVAVGAEAKVGKVALVVATKPIVPITWLPVNVRPCALVTSFRPDWPMFRVPNIALLLMVYPLPVIGPLTVVVPLPK